MARSWWALVLIAWVGVAAAAAPARKPIEASMLVTGDIEIDATGQLVGYTLDHPERLPGNVKRLLERQISDWTFQPNAMDGQPVNIRNRMGLLVLATPREDGNFDMRVHDASFYPVREEGYDIAVVEQKPPSFPRLAAENGVSGIVYLVLRIGADGRVEEAAAEQVNLRVQRSAAEMNRWRGVLARNAIEAAGDWRFSLPQHGELAAQAEPWVVRVPVNYEFNLRTETYGQWDPYVPGPRELPAWAGEDDGTSPAALAAGGLYPVGRKGGVQLAVPLQDG